MTDGRQNEIASQGRNEFSAYQARTEPRRGRNAHAQSPRDAERAAYFLQAFINIGLVPDAGATWLLPRLAGRARAMEMMMLGERIPAEQAQAWGMIARVVDDDALAEE